VSNDVVSTNLEYKNHLLLFLDDYCHVENNSMERDALVDDQCLNSIRANELSFRRSKKGARTKLNTEALYDQKRL
jgi:hypothetical protein